MMRENACMTYHYFFTIGSRGVLATEQLQWRNSYLMCKP